MRVGRRSRNAEYAALACCLFVRCQRRSARAHGRNGTAHDGGVTGRLISDVTRLCGRPMHRHDPRHCPSREGRARALIRSATRSGNRRGSVLDRHDLMRSGPGWTRGCRATGRVAAVGGVITAGWSTWCGGPGRAVRARTCRRSMGHGRRPTTGTAGGRPTARGSGCCPRGGRLRTAMPVRASGWWAWTPRWLARTTTPQGLGANCPVSTASQGAVSNGNNLEAGQNSRNARHRAAPAAG
jgi:hypothetical protein